MPIITGQVVTDPPPTTPPEVPADTGQATAVYYDPSGTAWPLTDVDPTRGYVTLLDGVSGLGAAPVALTTDPYPRGGVRLRHVQPQARNIVWPLLVYGSTHQEFTDRWRMLARAFTRTLREGPGILEIGRPDGGRRRIEVRYQEGWEGQTTYGDALDDAAVVTLLCEDPYWYDPVPVTERREHSAGSVGFLDNFFQLSSGRTLGSTTLVNPGDVTAWPEWTVTGPASLVTLTNTTTGESFALNPNAAAIGHGDLLAGQQVTISTNPKRVRYQNGDNWTGALNWPGATMWGLPPGESAVTFQLDGSGTGSAVDVAFMARYETA